jgi:DNA polymerase V
MQAKKNEPASALEFYAPDLSGTTGIPMAAFPVSAGFPSPADDYVETRMDLNELVVKRHASTFYVRVKGLSMRDAGIDDGDILVVDRAEEPSMNKKVVAVINGEFTVKVISQISGKLFLIPRNPEYKPTEITESMGFQVWGVVTYVIKKV